MQQSPDITLQTYSVPVSTVQTVQVAPGKPSLPQQEVARQSPITETRAIPLSSVIGSAAGGIQLIAASGGAQSWPTTVLPITYISSTPSSAGAGVLASQILTPTGRLPLLAGGNQLLSMSPGSMPQLIAINQFHNTGGTTATQTIPMLIQIPSNAQGSPLNKGGEAAT